MAEVDMATPGGKSPPPPGRPASGAGTATALGINREHIRISCRSLNVFYGDAQAIKDVDIDLPKNRVTAFIGPSGCGKSTVLRCLNRMNDLVPSCRVEGEILLDGGDIYAPETDVVVLRRKVGMVFQKSNPFPKTIFENVAYGLRLAGINDKAELSDRVESALQGSGLWSEVADRLNDNALGLSGGQQQRLCIARAMAVEPEVILMDEPCSALDPIATARIEGLIHELREHYTVVIVTHNMQQAARVSDYTAFFYLGELIEVGSTQELFTRPREQRTEDYVTGRFG